VHLFVGQQATQAQPSFTPSRHALSFILPPTHPPARTDRYTATLVNSAKANAFVAAGGRELQGGAMTQGGAIKLPFLRTSFSINLPDGVTVESTSTTVKGAKATVAGSSVTFDDLGSVRPGGKVQIKLRLVAAKCSTPDPLSLIGQFTYTANAATKTVDACLKKDLYVWAKSCDPIPSGAGSHKSYSTCTCPMCEVRWRWLVFSLVAVACRMMVCVYVCVSVCVMDDSVVAFLLHDFLPTSQPNQCHFPLSSFLSAPRTRTASAPSGPAPALRPEHVVVPWSVACRPNLRCSSSHRRY
jgi:hypothetical protein